MTLRFRCLLMDVVLLGVFLVGLYALTRFIVLEGMLRVEAQRTTRVTERIVRRLHYEQDLITQHAGDWAVWKDAARFVRGQNPTFTETQLTKIPFRELNLNFMAFWIQAVRSSGARLSGMKRTPSARCPMACLHSSTKEQGSKKFS